MTYRRIAAWPLAFAAAVGSIGTSGGVGAVRRPQAGTNARLPAALEREAIATRSDRHGRIAGARIGNTGTWVVYIVTARGCGSAGCRAQIWRSEGDRFVRGETLPVGRLPIVVLPQRSNGMPALGVTIYDRQKARLAILPVGFDGASYTSRRDDLLPSNIGRPLLAKATLRPF